MNSMKCLVNWIPLRIRIRSRKSPPHLDPLRLASHESRSGLKNKEKQNLERVVSQKNKPHNRKVDKKNQPKTSGKIRGNAKVTEWCAVASLPRAWDAAVRLATEIWRQKSSLVRMMPVRTVCVRRRLLVQARPVVDSVLTELFAVLDPDIVLLKFSLLADWCGGRLMT